MSLRPVEEVLLQTLEDLGKEFDPTQFGTQGVGGTQRVGRGRLHGVAIVGPGFAAAALTSLISWQLALGAALGLFLLVGILLFVMIKTNTSIEDIWHGILFGRRAKPKDTG